MESSQSTSTHTCCGCGKTCHRATVLYGVSIIILSGILALIAPPVIMKFGIPFLRIEPATEEMSIGTLGEMSGMELQQQEMREQSPDPVAEPASVDVSVQ